MNVTRRTLPAHFDPGDSVQAWVFLGYRIDRVLVRRGRRWREHEFTYKVSSLDGVLLHPPYLRRNMRDLGRVMANLVTANRLATAYCSACYQRQPVQANWLYAATSNPLTVAHLKLGVPKIRNGTRRHEHWRAPQCPLCSQADLSSLEITVSGGPVALGGLHLVVKGGKLLLVEVTPEGVVRTEAAPLPLQGEATNLPWLGQF